MALPRPKIMTMNMNQGFYIGMNGTDGARLQEMYDLVDARQPDVICVQDINKANIVGAFAAFNTELIMSSKGYEVWAPTASDKKLPGWGLYPYLDPSYTLQLMMFYKKTISINNQSTWFDGPTVDNGQVAATNGFIAATFSFPSTGETFAVFNIATKRGDMSIPTSAQSNVARSYFNVNLAPVISLSVTFTASANCLRVYAGKLGVIRSNTTDLVSTYGIPQTYGILTTLALAAGYSQAGTFDTFTGTPPLGQSEVCYIISSTLFTSPYITPAPLLASTIVNTAANSYVTPCKALCNI